MTILSTITNIYCFFCTINMSFATCATFLYYQKNFLIIFIVVVILIFIKKWLNKYDNIGDDTHMTSMKILQFSRPYTPLVHLCPKFSHLLDLWRPISNGLPPLQMMTNQLKENIIQGWLSYVLKSFLQVAFRFQYQLGFSLTSFQLVKTLLSAFSWLHTFTWGVVQK